LGLTLQKQIYCLGDSLTKRGTEQNNWPAYDFHNRVGPYANVVNQGVSGNIIQDCINRFQADVGRYRPHYVVVWIGINDVKFGAESNAADPSVIQTQLQSLIDSCKAIPAKCIMPTISPWSGGFWNANRETTRGLVNTWIKANTGVTPVDLEPTLADNTTPSHPILLAQYDNGDGLHTNAAGALACAAAIHTQSFGGALIPRP